MKSLVPVFLMLLLMAGESVPLAAQQNELLVKPYLQDATPGSIVVKWETAFGEESVVEYGTTPRLGNKTRGTAGPVTYGVSRLHEVKLTGLERLTTYYYRVKTHQVLSDIYQFKTPPFASDHQAFRITAMSDMQEDHRFPDKFEEMINDGLLSFLQKTYGGSVPDQLALMMIPGDLVENGTVYEQWKRDFFDPGSNLFSQVPVYPVPGNHENNSRYFFTYFTLPENGTPAHHEHWWYKDYGNVRIIGLDSNEGYRENIQLNWLEALLENTAASDSIDFVFAQLHHPYQSELWLDGEEDFTGEIVKRLEAFSSKTGKPSIHFFGHTHAYSRGQSRDHKHLWVNVATAGGNIDYWGEYAQRNYEEFTVSQDEYGFVMVDVDPNHGDPKFTLTRYSRGNENRRLENELRDSITVWRFEKQPEPPKPVYPLDDAMIDGREVIFKADAFHSDYYGAMHGASHWQVSRVPGFEDPEINQWRQFEDWYVGENQQEGDDLTDERVVALEPGTTYYWRVRYRDQNLNWSEWSEVSTFRTK